MEKEILKIKKGLQELGIDTSNVVYMPEIPIITGFPRECMIEEMYGMKVIKLVAAPNE